MVTQSYSQVIDTANFRIIQDRFGKYNLLTNKNTYYGLAAGTLEMPIKFKYNAIDTANWAFIYDQFGIRKNLVVNRTSIYGITAGNLQGEIIYDAGFSIGTATTSSGIATLNKLAGVITTDQLATTTGGPITVDNSYVTTSSIILVTLLTDDSDGTNQPHCTIRSIFSGQFTVDVYRDGASFIGEVQIHFLIIN